jgi:hypothetical protein
LFDWCPTPSPTLPPHLSVAALAAQAKDHVSVVLCDKSGDCHATSAIRQHTKRRATTITCIAACHGLSSISCCLSGIVSNRGSGATPPAPFLSRVLLHPEGLTAPRAAWTGNLLRMWGLGASSGGQVSSETACDVYVCWSINDINLMRSRDYTSQGQMKTSRTKTYQGGWDGAQCKTNG